MVKGIFCIRAIKHRCIYREIVEYLLLETCESNLCELSVAGECLFCLRREQICFLGPSKPCIAMMALPRSVLIARLALEGICPQVILAWTFLSSPRRCLHAKVLFASECLTWPVHVRVTWGGFDNTLVFPLLYLGQILLGFFRH